MPQPIPYIHTHIYKHEHIAFCMHIAQNRLLLVILLFVHCTYFLCEKKREREQQQQQALMAALARIKHFHISVRVGVCVHRIHVLNLRHKFCSRENEKCRFYREFLVKNNGNVPVKVKKKTKRNVAYSPLEECRCLDIAKNDKRFTNTEYIHTIHLSARIECFLFAEYDIKKPLEKKIPKCSTKSVYDQKNDKHQHLIISSKQ